MGTFDDGFVQQHVLHGVRADGVAVTLPACIVCQVEHGRITRLDEYFDSARGAVFRAPAPALQLRGTPRPPHPCCQCY